ncbi:hypothetical protein AQUCO_01000249v1 [Aquilegia coerulea]|uniref:Tify domain-containing protein n=1 Tax=Aquilegia coerulea TaxID=218851 RepID=A0A2G5E906_AQUCA|nr:hypothetical protein AQUCO_01000249v1 [Aquilegia coerulea]
MAAMNRKRLQRQSTRPSRYQNNGDFMIDYDSVNGGNDEYKDDEGNDQEISQRKQSSSLKHELTVSFAGQVYVFKEVSPEKVQAVLLLLGGREITTTGPTADSPFPINRGVDEALQHSNHSRRIASLARFREKRKERCFEKKVQSSKEVAQRMQHKNGQILSLSETKTKGLAGSSSWASPQSSYQDISTPAAEIVDSKCQHCGIAEKSTPVMHSGPAGPRSLCNACGLMWRNKEVSGETTAITMEAENLTSNDKQETSSETNTSIVGGDSLAAKDEQVGTEDMRPSSLEIGNCFAGSYEQRTAEDLTMSVPEAIDNSAASFDEQSAQDSGLVAQSLWGDFSAISSSNFWDLQGTNNDLAQDSTDIGIPSILFHQIVANDAFLGSGLL